MNTKIYCDESISSIRGHLEKRDYKYITYPKFIFLCGKGFDKNIRDSYWYSNRGIIHRYINKLLPDSHIVLSEQMWEDGFDNSIDLLTFEEFLAEVSDAIILFVESPGSFCELGAFAYADALFSDKLIVVMDEKYRGSRSFISTGPVLKAKGNGSKVLFAQIENGALLASQELRSEIITLVETIKMKQSRINKRLVNESENIIYVNSFIVELLELLKIVQPISVPDLLQLYKMIKGFKSFTFVKRTGEKFKREIKSGYILKLLQNSGIIQEKDSHIRLSNYKKTQNLMLKYHGNAMERERNRLICRKYRYGGLV
ncbi:MAG: retron St85 family effector protein [Clostridia bacterium]|nr:retron St85 family effector protein [Clostridia bacterium]MDD4799051.1 retron St85 family effector protein [Clostridia bacterium]